MPFLHWFRKKSQGTEAEDKGSGAEGSSSEPSTATQTTSEYSSRETVPDPPSIEQQSATLPVMPSLTAATQKEPTILTAASATTPHFSVPIGAFYWKLPPHLLAPERPDLTRLIEIAEEDVVIERETRDATVSLSILSLSCPDIFDRPVAGSDEIPITFSLSYQLPVAVSEPPDPPAAQTLENAIQEGESGSAEASAGACADGAGETVEPLGIKPELAKNESGSDSDQTGLVERRPPPTVRATTATGKINLPDPTTESAKRELRLRLEPILSNFPLGFEQPSIRALSETKAEIVLPLDVIESQLAHGRVVVPAAIFCLALPNDLKPYFETIEPTAEIPIPLREIFLRLPPDVIKLREDQEIDHPSAPIQTPFSRQAEEDAKRLDQGAPTPTELGPMPDKQERSAPNEADTPVPAFASGELRADASEQDVSAPPSPLVSGLPFRVDSERLHAIFMTDETLDLAKAIRMVGELPGLRACLLNTIDGLKLAGNLDHPNQEQAISVLVPELFEQARSKLASMRLGMLETITLYCGRDQLSTFIQGKFCLTVLHDNRPFKPGVREKVQAVISELVTLSTSEQEA